jgi:hypothetical protein
LNSFWAPCLGSWCCFSLMSSLSLFAWQTPIHHLSPSWEILGIMLLKFFKEGLNITSAQQMLVFLLPFVTCSQAGSSSKEGIEYPMSLYLQWLGQCLHRVDAQLSASLSIPSSELLSSSKGRLH